MLGTQARHAPSQLDCPATRSGRTSMIRIARFHLLARVHSSKVVVAAWLKRCRNIKMRRLVCGEAGAPGQLIPSRLARPSLKPRLAGPNLKHLSDLANQCALRSVLTCQTAATDCLRQTDKLCDQTLSVDELTPFLCGQECHTATVFTIRNCIRINTTANRSNSSILSGSTINVLVTSATY